MARHWLFVVATVFGLDAACAATGPVTSGGAGTPAEVAFPLCPAAAAARGLLPEDLGFSLPSRPLSPAQARAAIALIEDVSFPAPEVTLDALPPPQSMRLAGVAGAAPCRPPGSVDVLYVAGQPPRLLTAGWPGIAFERLAQGDALIARGQYPEARLAFASGRAAAGGLTAAFEQRLGESYSAEGRLGEALAIFDGLSPRFSWSAELHVGRAVALGALGRSGGALAAYAHALALRPHDTDLLSRVTSSMARADLAPPVSPPAWRRDGAQGAQGEGARWSSVARVGVPDDLSLVEAAAYARCKEAFRRLPDLRALAAGAGAPRWAWTPVEEGLCTAIWLEAYARNRGQVARAAEPALDLLVEIHQAGFGEERAIYDVGARVHPWAPALLSPARRARLFTFVSQFRVRQSEGGGLLLFP